MAMKSKHEIQMRLLKLKQRADSGEVRKSAIPSLIAAEDALAWVLNENAKDKIWSMQAGFDEEEEN